MSEQTRKLTTGAMFTAIFAVILLIDRQTGGMFEDMVMFLLPIPMVGYSSKYGFKSSIPVLLSMCLISVIVSTPTAIFYAVTEAIIGLVLGASVYAKKDMTKTMLAVMGLSAVVNVLNTIVLASLFGYDITSELNGTTDMITKAFSQSGANQSTIDQVLAMMTPQFMMQMLVVSMILMGLFQGFIVYTLSLLILRRLKFYVPKPRSVFLSYPPAWTGAFALLAFWVCNYTYKDGCNWPNLAKTIIQMVGICGYAYLIIFGFFAVVLLCRRFIIDKSIVGGIIAFLLLFTMPVLEMLLGVFYMIPPYHDKMIEGLNLGQENKKDSFAGQDNKNQSSDKDETGSFADEDREEKKKSRKYGAYSRVTNEKNQAKKGYSLAQRQKKLASKAIGLEKSDQTKGANRLKLEGQMEADKKEEE